MRRSLVVLALLPTLAAAQERPRPLPDDGAPDLNSNRGLSVGVTAFTGGDWQPSGVDLGLVRAAGRPGAAVGLLLRLGSFVQDQAVLVGGTQGFFAALFGVYRRPLADLAEVGTVRNPSYVRLVAVAELGGSLNFNSPLPQGGAHGEAALLLGLSLGGPGRIDDSFALLVGPAWFAGDRTTTHAQVSLRYQSSLGSRGRPRRKPRGPDR